MFKWGEVNESKKLIDLVEKNLETAAHGRFVDLSNDLGDFVDKYEDKEKDPLIMMAYAYARRVAVAGIYFQTIVGSDYFEYVNDIFKGWQGLTDGSYEFQEAAMAQALETLSYYVPELNKKKFTTLVHLAEQETDFRKLAEGMGIELEIPDNPNAYYPVSSVSALLDDYYRSEGVLEGAFEWDFLSNSIPMSEPSGWGGFVDMHNDLAAVTPFLDESSDALLLLAAAEAATIAALGNFIQGFMSESDLDQAYGILAKAQAWAGVVEVERLAAAAKVQAIGLTMRYIEEFRPHYAEILFEAAQSGITLPRLGARTDDDGFHSAHDVLRLLDPDRFS